MPTPTSAALENLAKSAVRNAGLEGEDAPALGTAMADLLAQVLQIFAGQTMVLPGIPAAVNPTSGTGSTVGPGTLLPPPAGGPNAATIEPLALGALQGAGLKGEDIPKLAGALADTIEVGLTMFCAQALVSPGITVAGFATAAPGRLS
ncbi:MAG: hypothetical protein AAF799_34640 [Myxococcota bacterium]